VPPNSVTRKPKHDPDLDFVKRAQNGDVEAFGILYGKYHKRIYNFCTRMIKDPFVAEDMLQESFLCAFRRIHSFRGDSLFSTWLHRIAINAVLMYFRRRKTSPTENADPELPSSEGELLEEERFHVEDRHLTVAVERITLENAINSLPPGYRTMFVLHDIEGFEHWEIAAILGCTPGNTKSQLFKARRRLRQLVMRSKEESENNLMEKIAAA
jgi:RNA polymerase sigma-70 factor (ECF subfamily)